MKKTKLYETNYILPGVIDKKWVLDSSFQLLCHNIFKIYSFLCFASAKIFLYYHPSLWNQTCLTTMSQIVLLISARKAVNRMNKTKEMMKLICVCSKWIWQLLRNENSQKCILKICALYWRTPFYSSLCWPVYNRCLNVHLNAHFIHNFFNEQKAKLKLPA